MSDSEFLSDAESFTDEEDAIVDDSEEGTEKDLSGDGGVIKKILKPGRGTLKPSAGDEVFVHYVGKLLDGTKFDSSRDRGDPFTFTLGKGAVIKGWDKGIAEMKKGETALLTCRADYAYGKSGSPPKIPADATLEFEVELLRWKSASDVLGDGSVLRLVTKEGEGWETPKAGAEVCVKYEGIFEDKVFDSSDGLWFYMGDASVPQGWNKVLKEMKRGEVAQLTLKANRAFGAEGKPPHVPGGATVVYKNFELVDWREVKDLFDDGGVVKKVLQKAEGYEKPMDGARVQVHVVTKISEGAEVHSTRTGSPLEFAVGNGDVCEALDEAVSSMKKGEVAELRCRAAYVAGHEATHPHVPPNSDLTLEVELVSFEKLKDSWSMTVAEKMASAESRKAAGNKLFKEGKLKRAIKCYDKALEPYEHEASLKEEEKAPAKQLKKAVYTNQAACHAKLGNHSDVIAVCKKALAIDGCHVKALFRRGQAYVATGEYLNAHADLARVAELDDSPQTQKDAAAAIARLKKLQAIQDKKDKKVFSKMFG